MIDPAAKLAAHEKSLAKLKTKRRKARKRRPLSIAEKSIIAEVVNDAPFNEVTPKQIEQVAVVLRRDERTIISAIVNARETLQTRALPYVDYHLAAVKGALEAGEFDVARKGAMEMIDKISARDADGKVERIVEKVEAESTAPRVQIGIMLGGLREK